MFAFNIFDSVLGSLGPLFIIALVFMIMKKVSKILIIIIGLMLMGSLFEVLRFIGGLF